MNKLFTMKTVLNSHGNAGVIIPMFRGKTCVVSVTYANKLVIKAERPLLHFFDIVTDALLGESVDSFMIKTDARGFTSNSQLYHMLRLRGDEIYVWQHDGVYEEL